MISISKVYCLFIVTASILNGYSFFFMRGFSFGMLFTSIFALCGLIKLFSESRKTEETLVSKKTIKLSIYLSIISVFAFLLNDPEINLQAIVFDLAKFFTWAFCIGIGAKYYNEHFIYKIMVKLGLIATYYIILQYMFIYLLKMPLPNGFDLYFIKPNYEGYEFSFSSSGSRPGSFWLEPAFYSYYMNTVLILTLFGNYKYESKIKNAIFFSVGILLSTSTGGLCNMTIIWFYYYWLKFNAFGLKISMIFLSILFLINLPAFITETASLFHGKNVVSDVMIRNLTKLNELDKNSRVGGSFVQISDLNKTQKLFGVGYGNLKSFLPESKSYVNAAVALIIKHGFLGFLFFLYFVLRLYLRQKTHSGKILCFIYFLGGFYSGIWFSTSSFLMLPILLYSNQSKCQLHGKRLNETYV